MHNKLDKRHIYRISILIYFLPLIKLIDDPYGTGKIAVVPPLNPDVAILHAQRADRQGNTQLWGLLGMQKEVAFASKHVIVVVEELVDESVIRADPNRTLIPGLIVDAVVHEPYGAHPSYVQGYYDRDNESYLAWDKLSQDHAAVVGVARRMGLRLGKSRSLRGQNWASPF